MPLSVNDAYDIGRKHERDRIIELLMTRLEQFDCDKCGECVTPKRLAEMISEQAQNNASE